MPSPRSSSARFGGRAACPLQTGDGVPGRFVGHQGFDAGDDLGLFFWDGGPPPPARGTRSTSDIALDELSGGPVAAVDGVDAEEGGRWAGRRPPALQRFESGEQPALAVVEEAGEQHDGGAQLLGHQVGVGRRPPESRAWPISSRRVRS